MITYEYRCRECEAVFEAEYASAADARDTGAPVCPNGCGSEPVVRHYGPSFFTGRKSNKGPLGAEDAQDPGSTPVPAPRFKPLEPENDAAGIVSLGFRVSGEMKQQVEKALQAMRDAGAAETIDAGVRDIPETLFGLRKGTPERTLFDIKQKKMQQELEDGEPVAGFYMPLEDSRFSSN